jgi:hypothetical protein
MAADSRCDTSAVARWLVQGARSAGQPADVLKQLCEQLITMRDSVVAGCRFCPHPPSAGNGPPTINIIVKPLIAGFTDADASVELP